MLAGVFKVAVEVLPTCIYHNKEYIVARLKVDGRGVG